MLVLRVIACHFLPLRSARHFLWAGSTLWRSSGCAALSLWKTPAPACLCSPGYTHRSCSKDTPQLSSAPQRTRKLARLSRCSATSWSIYSLSSLPQPPQWISCSPLSSSWRTMLGHRCCSVYHRRLAIIRETKGRAFSKSCWWCLLSIAGRLGRLDWCPLGWKDSGIYWEWAGAICGLCDRSRVLQAQFHRQLS